MDETVLIQAAQAGNKTAFRELYERNRQRVFGLAYQYVKNREDAEDILQDTFIKAFRMIHTYRVGAETNFAAWIFRVGINCSIDHLRRNKARRSEVGPEILDSVPSPTAAADPAREQARRELRGRIDECLRGLSPRQRMVFLLKHDEQHTIREIATELHCTEGSVKTHLFRAVANLRRIFKDLALEDPS
jgi:RNA polymerase sigma-70 factor (ECF subfamily)